MCGFPPLPSNWAASMQQLERQATLARRLHGLAARPLVLQYLPLNGKAMALLRDGRLVQVVDHATRIPAVPRRRHA